MADTNLNSTPLKTVQLESLVVMRIIKHCSGSHPTIATGSLVGMDVNGTLQVTNCFPFPTPDTSAQDARGDDAAHNALAAAAPRAKGNGAYQAQMVSMLRDVNIDANTVGWYTSTSMGNFFNINTIENQYFYQKEMNERTVALVYDLARSGQGALSIRAFRLSSLFMSSFKENRFTTEALQKSGLRFQDILQELPVTIHNSHLLTSLLHSLPTPTPSSSKQITAAPLPTSLADLTANPSALPLYPNFDTLELSIDPFLERSADLLLETLESHHVENNNAQYYQRSLAREQAKISAWQVKRKAENAARAAAKQSLLPEDEWTKLFKLPTEPSRLEMMLNSGQVEQTSKIVDGFAGTASAKLFAVKGNLLREEF